MIEHDLMILLARKLNDATERLNDFEESGDLEDKLDAASEHADLHDAFEMMKRVIDKTVWLKEQIAEAERLMTQAIEIMDTDQLSGWAGVRAWMERQGDIVKVKTHNAELRREP